MRINVMHVMLDVEVGGTQNFVLNLLRNLDKSRFNTSVCCLWSGGSLESEFRNLEIPFYILKKDSGFDMKLIFKLSNLLKKHQTHVLHSHHLGPLIYALPAAKLAGIQCHIHTEHSYGYLKENKKYFLLAKMLFSGVKKVVGVSDDVTDFFKNTMGIRDNKITTIVNGIDVRSFAGNNGALKTKTRSDMGLLSSDFIIGTIGRLDPVKNHAGLIHAFKEAMRTIPNAKLLIAGDGQTRSILENEAHSEGITSDVKLLGMRKDIPALLNAIDIFILPSFTEGLSLALLEAMAAGRPVIASNVGGNKDIIRHGENGLLVNPHDTRAIADAIGTLYRNPDLRSKLAYSASRSVQEKYSIETMVERYESLYQGA